METEKKQAWVTPEVTECGDVEDLTQQSKLKSLGSADDFGITGITDAP